MDNIHPIILPIACGIWISATIFLYLGGLFDSLKAMTKHKRRKYFEENNITYTYKDLRPECMSHHFKLFGKIWLGWWIWPHLIGLSLCFVFYKTFDLWQIFPAYILKVYAEDTAYYVWSKIFGWVDDWPSKLPWLISDAPKFIRPFLTWVFRTEQVLWKDFVNALIHLNALSLIVTIILTLIFY